MIKIELVNIVQSVNSRRPIIEQLACYLVPVKEVPLLTFAGT
jgi:hypothetical protein